MLNPAYIAEALEKKEKQQSNDLEGEQTKRRFGGEERINPKLKQW